MIDDNNKGRLALLFAIVVFLVNQFPFLEDMRPVMYDEAWYGDTAYNLTLGNGFANSIVGEGGNANFLLPLVSSGFLLLFGYNLFALRLTAVLCGVTTIVILTLLMRWQRLGWKTMALVSLFFVSIPLFNTVFRFGRPECLALMCSAGGLWFYYRYRSHDTWQNILGMSLFALAAGCSHPFALFLFALIGAALLLQALTKKKTKSIVHLSMLVASALICLVIIVLLSNTYNVGGGGRGVLSRFSVQDAMKAIPVYFKEAFLSRAVLYMLPSLGVIVYEAYVDKENRQLAMVALVHFLVFPILFSTDLMMVGLGQDYVVLAATVLLAPFIERMVLKKKKWIIALFVVYCIGCFGISYYYNYGVKYEKANSVLTEDLQKVVPEGSKVFGPIRQWPMLMQTDYQSEHTVLPIEQIKAYDFFILNTQDTAYYATYKAFLPIDESKLQLVYEKPTKQYGKVQVYKAK